MSTLGIYVYLIGGVLALYLGAEILVFFASRLALSMGMSNLMTGLTIVAASTSMPELVSSLMAQLQGGFSSIALGNIIGSNIANIGLILGILAIAYPMKLHRNVLNFEAPLGVILVCVLWLMMLSGKISRLYGLFLIAGFLAYLFWHVHQARTSPKEERHLFQDKSIGVKLFYLVLLLIGALVTIYGGYLFIRGAIALALRYEISPRIIGLTVVAVGSSLPEFAASFIALIRKNPALAIGNIFGSNILNILMVLGIVACVKPIPFSSIFLIRDMPILLIFAFMAWFFGLKRKRLSRFSGGVLLVAYICYLFYIW